MRELCSSGRPERPAADLNQHDDSNFELFAKSGKEEGAEAEDEDEDAELSPMQKRKQVLKQLKNFRKEHKIHVQGDSIKISLRESPLTSGADVPAPMSTFAELATKCVNAVSVQTSLCCFADMACQSTSCAP